MNRKTIVLLLCAILFSFVACGKEEKKSANKVAEAKFNGTYTGYRYKYCLGEGGCDYNAYIRDDSIKKREHYHNGTTSTILMLPASVN